MIKISVDAMGGDLAPAKVIDGVYLALKEHPINIALVGPEKKVRDAVAKIPNFPLSRVTFHNASDVVSMSDNPMESFKKKKDSSIYIGLELVKNNLVQGFVSAGNTGAVMLTSIMLLGRIKGVDRPAIATVLPTNNGQVVLLDIGSNVDCKPKYLAQFAKMGSLYAEFVLGNSNPKVALLNIGEEQGKGNAATQGAYPLIEKQPLNFIGNLEGKEIFSGRADVVVCDGFVGNNVVKFGEGVTKVFLDFFKNEAKSSLLSKIGLFFLWPALKRFKKGYDYTEYGGAPLLGVNGVSIIAHGKSNALAMKNAIGICVRTIENEMVEKISQGI